MKQIWPNYSYSPATNVLTLTGLNIDRDQLLLVTAADRGRIMYNFADSSVTASAFTSGANTALTLVTTTAGLTTTAALVIYYDDQLQSTSVSISNLPSTQTIAGTVTANVVGFNSNEAFGTGVIQSISDAEKDTIRSALWIANASGVNGSASEGQILSQNYPMPISGTVTANIPLVNIQPTVTTGLGVILLTDEGKSVFDNSSSIKATLTSALPTGTNRIGVVTIGAGTVTLGASTSQIGSVTASISGTVPISISSVTVGNSVTIGSLPSLVAGTAQIGSVTASISNSVTIASLPAISGTVTANTFALQGTAVTTSNFTSTTASTVLANFDATREVLTIFNEGAGNLHICAGATCTTIAYQVRLSAGDYYEVPNHQTTITHSAVFATAGTARIVQIS